MSDAVLAYRQRPRPTGAETAYRIEDATLVVDRGNRIDRVPLGAVKSLRLTYESDRFGGPLFKLALGLGPGGKLSLTNVTWRGVIESARQDAAYGVFARALIGAVVRENPACRLDGGRNRFAWLMILVVALLTAAGLVVFAVRALAYGAPGAALIGTAILALATWQIGPLIRRNRPRAFAAGQIPADLLP